MQNKGPFIRAVSRFLVRVVGLNSTTVGEFHVLMILCEQTSPSVVQGVTFRVLRAIDVVPVSLWNVFYSIGCHETAGFYEKTVLLALV